MSRYWQACNHLLISLSLGLWFDPPQTLPKFGRGRGSRGSPGAMIETADLLQVGRRTAEVARRALLWWRDELWHLVPPRVREALSADPIAVEILLGGRRARATNRCDPHLSQRPIGTEPARRGVAGGARMGGRAAAGAGVH